LADVFQPSLPDWPQQAPAQLQNRQRLSVAARRLNRRGIARALL